MRGGEQHPKRFHLCQPPYARHLPPARTVAVLTPRQGASTTPPTLTSKAGIARRAGGQQDPKRSSFRSPCRT